MKPKLHKAWAIDTRSLEGHGMLGIWSWFDGSAPKLPMHVQGCTTALWATRAEVRKAYTAARIRKWWPRARIVRVELLISKPD